MSELGKSLAELRRLGLHLEPEEAAAEAERRRVRANTVTYPRTRALGFHLLLLGVVVHNAALFGALEWGTLLAYVVVVETYVVLSWLALRRWYTRFPPVHGWDLADLLFVADLALWAGAIHVTGGPESLLWILPLLRVADHHPVPRVRVFVHLAPLTYAAVLAWAAVTGRPPADWGLEGVKLFVLYGAGLYIALAARPTQRYRAQRAAAMDAATALLGDVAERTRRLDEANRSRGQLIGRLGGEIREALVRIGGLSGFLLQDERGLPPAARSYVERIRREARSGLRRLDEGVLMAGPAPNHPRLSLAGLLQKAAAQEAQDADDWREAASLRLPAGDAEIEADGPALGRVLRHLLSAARHFGGRPPDVELRTDTATGMPEAVVLQCSPRSATVPPAGAGGEGHSLAGDDPAGANARLELELAQSISSVLGYRLDLSQGPEGRTITLWLR